MGRTIPVEGEAAEVPTASGAAGGSQAAAYSRFDPNRAVGQQRRCWPGARAGALLEVHALAAKLPNPPFSWLGNHPRSLRRPRRGPRRCVGRRGARVSTGDRARAFLEAPHGNCPETAKPTLSWLGNHPRSLRRPRRRPGGAACTAKQPLSNRYHEMPMNSVNSVPLKVVVFYNWGYG